MPKKSRAAEPAKKRPGSGTHVHTPPLALVPAPEPAAEWVPITELRAWANNPRKNDHAVASVVDSIRAFGFGAPILARRANSEVIAGHTRLKAAAQLGMTTVPVRYLDLDEERAHLLAIADNRLGEAAIWDDAVLGSVLADLKAKDVADLHLAGFSERDLHELTTPETLPSDTEDETPPLPDVAITQPGDLYTLGRHRLLCGDSTNADDMRRLMAGGTAALCFTDPPYNADYSSRVDKTRRKPWGGIKNDNMSDAAFAEFIFDALSIIKEHVVAGGAVYVWTDWKQYPLVASVYRDVFTQKGLIVWDKQVFGLGSYYRTQHEFCLFGCLGDRVVSWHAEHDECDVWSVPRDSRAAYVHPTQKPTELARRAMVNSSTVEAIVLDAFGGSGSTLVACETTGRSARVMELDPKYCDVIVARWERITGLKAERAPSA